MLVKWNSKFYACVKLNSQGNLIIFSQLTTRRKLLWYRKSKVIFTNLECILSTHLFCDFPHSNREATHSKNNLVDYILYNYLIIVIEFIHSQYCGNFCCSQLEASSSYWRHIPYTPLWPVGVLRLWHKQFNHIKANT